MICLFLWVSLLTFDIGDWPSADVYPHNTPTQNACGRMGAWVAYEIFYWIGDGAFLLLLFLSFAAGLWLVNGRVRNLGQRAFGVVLLVCCTSTTVRLMADGGPNSLAVGDGGVLGVALAQILLASFSKIGTVLVLLYCLLVGLLFAAEGWMLRIPGAMERLRDASAGAASAARSRLDGWRPALAGTGSPKPDDSDGRTGGHKSRTAPKINSPRRPSAPPSADDPDHGQGELFDKESGDTDAHNADAGDAPTRRRRPGKADPDQPDNAGAEDDHAAGDKTLPVVRFPKPQPRQDPPTPYPKPVGNWNFPPLPLLHEPEYGFTAQQESIVRAKARTLEQTLEEFRLDAQVVEIDTGPVITMFEIRLAAGIKVSQVASLSNDIARALKAPAVRVVAPIPGKNTVGIEVPNVDKEKVRLRELINLAGAKAQKMRLPVFIGKDASGAALLADLTTMPHMLIAGTTGSGKSICINSMIASFLMTKKPDEVKLILVDPKMVEMSQFKEIPHLMSPIITDMNRAEQILDWAVTKMEERYEILAEARVRNIATYNKLGEEEIVKRFMPSTDDEKAKIPVKMPYIVVVIDELADLMMTSAKEVEHHLARLAQKSRAVGIHIIVATQRPEAKVVTGLIKSNMPCRIAFRVASRMDSRIVLDQNGAEVLMGQGDMLFLPPGSAKLIRAQGTLLEDDELHRIIEFLTSQAKPEFHPQLVRLKPKGMDGDGERDPLFDDAVACVLQTRRGSVSLLQRRLSVGYSRASRLIEQMAAAGIVGEFKGSQAREVVITPDEWNAMRAGMQRDLEQDYAADADDFAPDPVEDDDTPAADAIVTVAPDQSNDTAPDDTDTDECDDPDDEYDDDTVDEAPRETDEQDADGDADDGYDDEDEQEDEGEEDEEEEDDEGDEDEDEDT